MLYPIELLAHMEIPIGLEPMILGLQPSALPLGYGIIVGAGGGTWTHTVSLPADFESAASAIPPRQLIFTEHLVWFDQLKVDSMYKIAVCALYGTGNRGRTCTG